MKLNQILADWLVTTQVVSENHVIRPAKADGWCTLTAEASRAVDSGHLAFYVLHNLAVQMGIALPREKQLKGAPGEVSTPAQRKINWSIDLELLALMSAPFTLNLEMLINGTGTTQALDSIREFWETSLTPAPDADAKAPQSTADAAIQSAQEKYARKVAKAAEQEAKEQRRRQNAELLKQAVVMSLDVERYRMDLTSVGAAPLPVYTEFKNRAMVQFCHSIVENIIMDVGSGVAAARYDEQWVQQQHVREAARQRKEVGRRLMDLMPAVQVSRDTDHRIALMCKDIVVEIVNRCADPNIIDYLARRDQERDRDRVIVNRFRARFEMELEEKMASPALPLKLRIVRAKQEAEALAVAERREREVKVDTMREQNKQYALEQQKLRRQKEQQDWQAAAEAREKAQRRQEELEQHKALSKMLTLHNKMRRMITDMEEAERDEAVHQEAAHFKRLLGIATRERREIRERAEAESAPATPLSSVSVGSGFAAGYLGSSYGAQFLTAVEASLLDVVNEVRSSPGDFVAVMQTMQNHFRQHTLLVSCRDGSQEPMLTVEGAQCALDAIAHLGRARPCKPAEPEPCIGLTLAAREHAIDLAHHGIAHSAAHIGTNRSTTSQRVNRYGNASSLSGNAVTELISAFVRPTSATLTADAFVNQWLLCDGDDQRIDRKLLLGNGASYTNVGVGHAFASFDDRVVEVYVVLFCADFADKAVSVMASAHQSTISNVAPSFLSGNRHCISEMTTRLLFAAPNRVIGRTAPPPNLKLLTQPLRSPRYGGPASKPARDAGSAKSPQPAPGDDRARRKSMESPAAGHHTVDSASSPQPKRLPPVVQKSNATKHEARQRGPAPMEENTAQKLPPMQQRPSPPPLPLVADEPFFTPEPKRKQAFVGAPSPLPPAKVTSITPTVRRSVAMWKLLLLRAAKRRKDVRAMRLSATQVGHYGAMLIQRAYRVHVSRTLVRYAKSDRRAHSADNEAEALQQERDYSATMIAMKERRRIVDHEVARREAFAAARSVTDVITTLACDSWLTQRMLDSWKSRCLNFMTGPAGADRSTAIAQLERYQGRELALLASLVKLYGSEFKDDCRALCAILSMDDAEAMLLDHVGYEEDLLCRLDRTRACVVRCKHKWRDFVAIRKKRPEYVAALRIQRLFRSINTAERVEYTANHRARIKLKIRLESFYTKYNPSKVVEAEALAIKYVGAEDRLFEALVAKYGPE